MSDYPVVLYVEDDPSSRMVMEILLISEMNLTNVTIYEDSTDFESRIDELHPTPDVVFLDIHMLPIDGFRMLEILRARPEFANVPIVALTASVMNDEVAKLKKSGFTGVISKPINLDFFQDTLAKLLKGEEVWRIVDT